eukprot:7567660-Pyramimonas_sp.AAC.1
MNVWPVHDDSDIALPSDCGEWELLPYITIDMMVAAVLSFKGKTAAARLRGDGCVFHEVRISVVMASWTHPFWDGSHSQGRWRHASGGTDSYYCARVGQGTAPSFTSMAEAVPFGDGLGHQE